MISQKENGAGPSVFKRRALPLGKLAIPPPGTVHLWFLDFDRLGNPLQGDEQAPASGLNARQARSKAAFMRLLLRIHMRRLCSGWRGVAALASLVYVSVRVVASAACQAVSRSLSGDPDASAEVLVA